jgi:hypothetical protein
MRLVGVAPVADAGEKQQKNPEPQEPTLAEIPIVPIRMTHRYSPVTEDCVDSRSTRVCSDRLTGLCSVAHGRVVRQPKSPNAYDHSTRSARQPHYRST